MQQLSNDDGRRMLMLRSVLALCVAACVFVFLSTPSAAVLLSFYISSAVNNAIYPMPMDRVYGSGYTCLTNYYVNASTGSDANNGTSTGTAWQTPEHAMNSNTVFGAGVCINLAPGSYNVSPLSLSNSSNTAGTSNSATGYAVLRCSTPAQPYLYSLTLGTLGSNPVCKLNSTSTSDYNVLNVNANYVLVDGVEVTQTFGGTASIVGSPTYNSGTGIVSVTLASSVNVCPQIGVQVSGITGTGSFNLANGYFFAASNTSCAGSPATTTTVTYNIGTGLTLTFNSGGTLQYVTGGTFGTSSPPGNPNPNTHHFVVLNSLFHDLGGAGLSTLFDDNVFWFGNVVYNTAWTNGFDGSGIAINSNINASYTNAAWDDVFGSQNGVTIRNVIANNVVYANGNIIAPQSDGNGIILDSNNVGGGSQNTCNTTSYSYGFLVYGNVIYGNGGRGIHQFYSSNGAVLNNTVYNNNLSTLSSTVAGLSNVCGSGNTWANNISYEIIGLVTQLYNTAAQSWTSSNTDNSVLWSNNLMYYTGSGNTCGNLGLLGTDHLACYDANFSTILSSAPATWSSGTTYAAKNIVQGSDLNSYVSLVGSNLNFNPVSEAPTPGSRGTHWQNNGPSNNVFSSDPKFVAPTSVPPNLALQNGSPARNASTSAVTALGGYAVATPNVGAY